MKNENRSYRLIGVVNDPDHPLMQEAMNTFNSKEGDTIKCKRCGNDYVRGIFNFYDLCDCCMGIFNRAKRLAFWRQYKNLSNE
jgi:hypothetical protein